MVENILAVMIGGGLGAAARYLLTLSTQGVHGIIGEVGTATLVINVAGCFLMGVITGISGDLTGLRENLRLLVTTGFLGGFTTFSAYGLESVWLLESGHAVRGVFNIILTNTLGLLAVAWGLRIFK